MEELFERIEIARLHPLDEVIRLRRSQWHPWCGEPIDTHTTPRVEQEFNRPDRLSP
jgi:hypothetical protein